jgi:hypothetical protein
MRCFLSTLPRGFQTWLGGKSGHQSSKKFLADHSRHGLLVDMMMMMNMMMMMMMTDD